MTGSELERRVERSRERLACLRERAGREGRASEALLDEAIEALGQTVEELAATREELAEAQLAGEEYSRRYQDLFRSAPDAYVVTEEGGVIREVNAAAERQFQRSGRSLVGEALGPLVAQSDRERFRERLAALQEAGGRLSDLELRFGCDAPFDASVSAVSEQRNGDLEIRWTLRDVTELRQRDAFRDEIERHLEPVVWLQQLDPLRMLHVSPVYETIWGRPLASLQENPRDWLESVHPDDRPRVEKDYERLCRGEAFDVEYRILRPDGEVRWIHGRGTPFRDGQGRLDRAAGIAEDVTEKKAAEAALRKAERQRRAAALAAEKAEARERRALARDLHDALGQSLALAQTKLAGLRDEAGESKRAARLREIESLITEAADRTRTLTFRLSPTILHDIGLAAAAEWLADDLVRRFGLNVQVNDTGLQEPLPMELREALFRSLRELLINVARHARTDKAEVCLAEEDGVVSVLVEDEGIGFEVGRGGNPGFGLVSLRERLEALGGRLEIDSQVGRGTRARLVVPVPGED